MMYTDIKYANSRLLETVLMHPLGAARIEFIDSDVDTGKLKAAAFLCKGGKRIYDYLDNFQYESAQLGFSNYRHVAMFFARKPMRKDWKQGLRTSNVICLTPYKTAFNPAIHHDCLNNEYPTVEQAIKDLEGLDNPAYSVAFHRHFAVAVGDKLHYKAYGQVGFIHSNKTYEILPGFEWVEESLKEALGA